MRVKPVESFKNNSFFPPSPPLHQSKGSYLGCPSSFDVAAIIRGLLSFWADRSTPLIPVRMGWMGKTEDSTAWGSNRSASPPLWSLFFIGEEGRGGERRDSKKRWGVIFPMRMLTGGQVFLDEAVSEGKSSRISVLQHLEDTWPHICQTIWKLTEGLKGFHRLSNKQVFTIRSVFFMTPLCSQIFLCTPAENPQDCSGFHAVKIWCCDSIIVICKDKVTQALRLNYGFWIPDSKGL